MKKFKFKLEGLLRIKISEEREIKSELIEIQSLCEQQRSKVDQTSVKIEDWSVYYNKTMSQGGHASQLAVIDHHIQKLYRYRDQLEVSLDVLERKKKDVIQQFQEIQKEVKMIEHIKEKKLAEYREYAAREEMNTADELATLRYIRERGVA